MSDFENNPESVSSTSEQVYEPYPAQVENTWDTAGSAAENSSSDKKEKKEKKSKGLAGKIIAIILICAIIGSLCAIGGKTIYDKYSSEITTGGIGSIFKGKIDSEKVEEVLPTEVPEIAKELPPEVEETPIPPAPAPAESKASSKDNSSVLSPADIYESNVNSTVGITIKGQQMTYWGITTYEGAGSGFIISEDGYILTNYHVIQDSSEVSVETFDEKSYDAEVIGYDEDNDVAVLKIEASGLVPVTIGDSDTLRVGDTVLAIGNPLGKLSFSLTQGVVSALSRKIALDGGVNMSLIQTDCAINSGNSGGALFDMSGNVIGITNAKYSSSGYSGEASIDNIGFAIPINTLKPIYSSIIEKGYVTKPYIGVTIQDITEDMMKVTGLEYGVMVASVTDESPAEEGGLLPNDIILKVNDVDTKVSSDLTEFVSSCETGDIISLEVYRQGEKLTFEVTIGEKISSPAAKEEKTEDTPKEDEFRPDENYGNYGDFFDYYYGNGNSGFGIEDFFNFFGGAY